MRPTFFDTNILVYTGASSAAKQKHAVNMLNPFTEGASFTRWPG